MKDLFDSPRHLKPQNCFFYIPSCPVQILWWDFGFKNLKTVKATEEDYMNIARGLVKSFLECKEVSTLSHL